MPLNILRLNQRHQHPTPHVIFLKPLPGPTAPTAEAFLARIAALMHPILRAHHLSVTALEEFPANAEFVGRNFNHGECIQLVLRARGARGAWLPFRAVAMVMVHELAHCEQMNHGRAFWALRNAMAGELRALWTRGYTGEGVWGRGRELGGGAWAPGGPQATEAELPPEVCGGVYRSRRRGRKRKRDGEVEKQLTWREREDRRIKRKFGENGVALGDDEEQRRTLEGWGKSGKPRVAGSKRGRELRAAAALARFDTQKQEQVKKEEDSDFKEDTPSADESGEDEDAGPGAQDVDGSQLLDAKGRTMVKVCDGEDADDVHVKREMDEMLDLSRIPLGVPESTPQDADIKSEEATAPTQANAAPEQALVKQEQFEEPGPAAPAASLKDSCNQEHPKAPAAMQRSSTTEKAGSSGAGVAKASHGTPTQEGHQGPPKASDGICRICSLENEPTAWMCAACAHVLKPHLSPGSWKCTSAACKGSAYRNAADCGLCGLCGAKKP